MIGLILAFGIVIEFLLGYWASPQEGEFLRTLTNCSR